MIKPMTVIVAGMFSVWLSLLAISLVTVYSIELGRIAIVKYINSGS